ncbi:unnamed protein product [Darwinula stevensoni]|uniref:Uncharacterized protein n=1 Tax=Darwinula stevensoni TaxID=69355 RepID=A0A7R8XBE3_9CRUS|nr:unnamed protein product [Darwinula stevensoni]CAG0892304.1 unnamed protein product [Darwinula stevensoni]
MPTTVIFKQRTANAETGWSSGIRGLAATGEGRVPPETEVFDPLETEVFDHPETGVLDPPEVVTLCSLLVN